jgi:hypothetical protein
VSVGKVADRRAVEKGFGHCPNCTPARFRLYFLARKEARPRAARSAAAAGPLPRQISINSNGRLKTGGALC